MKKLIFAALVAGAAVAIAKKMSADRAEWHGLSEDQVREKLSDRLPGKMPDEAKAAVTDKIVDKMREKGHIIDLTESATETADADEAVADNADANEAVGV